jgi:DNA-binding response OmpR family regulator
MSRRAVLLVDDNTAFRESLAALLTDDGAEICEASCGREALERAKFHALDLAILDLNLPDTTGVQVYTELLREKATPCIFMTAEAETTLVDEAISMNPVDVLRKPFELALFRALVRRVLR